MEPFEELEVKLGKWAGNKNMVACSSGSSALHLALEALELPEGSGVLLPEFTMISCARAVVMAGLKPIFIDCKDDLLIDCNLIQKEIRPRNVIRAIMPVHIYGRRCNMKMIREYADCNSLKVIEDMAEIHGVHPHPETDAACWSFYKNKIVAGEEGGAIAFKNPGHATRAKCLRSVGFTKDHNFLHEPRGINARMSNGHASLIMKSLECLEYNTCKRAIVEKWYNQSIPEKYHMPIRNVCWVYDLRIPGMESYEQCLIIRELNRQNIAARYGFKPMSMQPEFAEYREHKHLNSYRLSQEIIYLPVYPDMTKEVVQGISNAFTSLL